MSDETAGAPARPSAPGPAPERVPVTPSRRRRVDRLALAYLLGFVILAATLVYLVRHPAVEPARAGDVARTQTQVEQLAAEVATLSQRLDALAKRPQAAPVDLGPVEAQMKGLASRVAQLEARPAPAPGPTVSPAQVTALAGRLDQIAARQDALAGHETSDVAAINGRLDTVEQRIAAAEQAAGKVGALTAQAQRLARLQAASAALDAGQPLGSIPDAPPALARFAKTPPPTLGTLRLGFPAAAKAAHAASQPALTQGQPFLSRMWARAQQAVTVRDGTRVVLGDPIAGVLETARRALDAGDLAGAVHDLDGLAGPAAAAMKPWRDQAQALLDARAALTKLAAAA